MAWKSRESPRFGGKGNGTSRGDEFPADPCLVGDLSIYLHRLGPPLNPSYKWLIWSVTQCKCSPFSGRKATGSLFLDPSTPWAKPTHLPNAQWAQCLRSLYRWPHPVSPTFWRRADVENLFGPPWVPSLKSQKQMKKHPKLMLRTRFVSLWGWHLLRCYVSFMENRQMCQGNIYNVWDMSNAFC